MWQSNLRHFRQSVISPRGPDCTWIRPFSVLISSCVPLPLCIARCGPCGSKSSDKQSAALPLWLAGNTYTFQAVEQLGQCRKGHRHRIHAPYTAWVHAPSTHARGAERATMGHYCARTDTGTHVTNVLEPLAWPVAGHTPADGNKPDNGHQGKVSKTRMRVQNGHTGTGQYGKC